MFQNITIKKKELKIYLLFLLVIFLINIFSYNVLDERVVVYEFILLNLFWFVPYIITTISKEFIKHIWLKVLSIFVIPFVLLKLFYYYYWQYYLFPLIIYLKPPGWSSQLSIYYSFDMYVTSSLIAFIIAIYILLFNLYSKKQKSRGENKMTWKKVIWPGLVAGFVMLIVSMILNPIFMALFPRLATEYANASLFRAADASIMQLYFVYPFLLGILLAWGWNLTKKVFPKQKRQEQWHRGLQFGFFYWVIATIPGMFMSYTSFQLSLTMVLVWALFALLQVFSGAITLVKIQPK